MLVICRERNTSCSTKFQNLRQTLLILLFIPVFAFTQVAKPLNLPKYDLVKLHFGMALGMGTMSGNIQNADNFYALDSMYSVECNPQIGFNINIVSNFNINKYFSIRFLPGLNFGQRNMEYVFHDGTKFDRKIMEIESTYLDFPVLLQFKSARLNNFRVYVVGGFSYKYDLSAQKKISDEEKPKIRLTPNVLSYELGFGTEFFLQYFKFAVEAKMSYGMNNVIRFDNSQFTTSMNSMRPNMLSITLLFEGSDIEGLNFLKWFKKN